MRDVIQEHLRALVALLSGFVLASAVVLVADAPAWSRIVAALLAIVSLSLAVAWLRLPWAEWKTERGWRIAAVATPAAAAILVLAVGMALRPDARADAAAPATLILFDSSAAMADTLEGEGSKLQEATDALARNARDLGEDQLGLASFGVEDCDSASPLEELVPIRPDRAEEIKEKAAELSAAGRSNLVSAARNAIGLLNPFTDDRRRLLVITAGLDDCGGELAELVAESELKEVPIQWELVGLGLSPEEKAALDVLPDAVTVHLADSSDELEEAFRLVLFEEPIRDELETLTAYVETDVREPLNSAIAAFNARPPRSAETRRHVAVLRERSAHGEERFGEFGTDDGREAFAPVKDLLGEQFELLQEAAAAADDIASFDEEHGGELNEKTLPTRDELVQRLNDVVGAYNENLPKLGDRIEAALESLFSR